MISINTGQGKMEEKLQERIIESINFKSKKLKVSMNDGKFAMLKAVTFSQLCKLLGDNDKKLERLREIKKQLLGLVDSGVIVEIESEPSFYLLGKEFEEKVGTKSNIGGIEGFA